MILIRFGVRDSGPSFMLNIWKFVFKIEIEKNRFLHRFIKGIQADRREGILEKGQQFSYNVLNVSIAGTKEYLLLCLRIFSLSIHFGFVDTKYKKFIHLKYYKMEKR